ncbi:hypothetical protein AgCh_002050 [Apium graveolens]
MNIEDVHPGPVNPSLLHLKHTHRSLDISRLGGGDMLKCRRKNPNNEDDLPPLDLRMVPLLQSTGFHGVAQVASLQLDWSLISALVERWRPETHTFHLPMGEVTITLPDVGVLLGLPLDGDAVISDVTPGPDMSWRSYVAELFGRDPDPKRHEWIQSSVVLYCFMCSSTELCKTSKKDVDEVAGCLILLQLWAWERLPTLAPIRTSSTLFDARFWEGQVAAPRGLRWLHGHSYTSTGCRTLSAIRTLLDGLGPSQFIWQPYSPDVISELPAYYFTGERIWRYCGPLICIFIVELYYPDGVARQFGLVQTIPVDVVYSEAEHSTNLGGNDKIRWIQKHVASTSIWADCLDHLFVRDAIVAESSVPKNHPWYLERTVRFISRVGVFNHRIDLMFRQISERTQDVLPNVSRYADQRCDFFRAYTLHGFDEMPVEVHRARQLKARRARVLVDDNPVAVELGADGIPLHSDSHDVPESSTHARTDHMATDLGDDRDPPVRDSVAHTNSVYVSGSSSHVQHDPQILDRYGYVPSFDLGLTPTPEQPRTEDPSTEHPRTEDPSTEQPPPLHRSHRPTKHVSMDFSIPSFSLHVTPTPPTDPDAGTDVTSSQSIQDQSSQDRPGKYGHFYTFQGKRRSKRTINPPNCGTDGQKCAKK